MPVASRDNETLLAVIRECIAPGMIIMSDCWAACNNIRLNDYKHYIVNHKYNFEDPKANAYTQTWKICGLEQRGEIKENETAQQLLDSYLQEFMVR